MHAPADVAAKAHRRCKPSAFIFTTIAALTMSAAFVVAPAAAQTTAGATPPGNTPSVGVTPTDTHQDDPNSGQWFVFKAGPGETVSTEARIGNPATIPQTVKLYLADLVFGKDGTPTIPNGDPTDIGKWGAFERDSVVIQPQDFVRVRFSLTVPPDADPGDHVGAVVVESAPEKSETSNALKIIKRVATRLYVTVPGDATQSYKISDVSKKLTSKWGVPRGLEVTTLLTNTGRVRLRPIVNVNGVRAGGTEVLLARSVEKYVARVHVPWYGGPVTAHVKVDSEAGTKTVAVSLFVIPWGTIAMIPVCVLLAFGLRALNRFRQRRVRRLLADVRRLEGMVTERQTGEAAAMAALETQQATLPAVAPTESSHDDTGHDHIRGLREAFKRAHRAGAQTALENAALALHAEGVDARADLAVALEHAEGDRRELIEAAFFSYEHAPPPPPITPEVETAPEPSHERAEFLARLHSAFDDEAVVDRN